MTLRGGISVFELLFWYRWTVFIMIWIYWKGIDREAMTIRESKFSDYMLNYQLEKDSLRTIVKYVLNLHDSTKRLKEKYCDY